jgi:hypothetical protein
MHGIEGRQETASCYPRGHERLQRVLCNLSATNRLGDIPLCKDRLIESAMAGSIIYLVEYTS